MTTVTNGPTRHLARAGGAAKEAVQLDWIGPAEADTDAPVPAVDWWNTGVRFIRNFTTAFIRVRNQETNTTLALVPPASSISPGTRFADWFMPWCNSYDEVTTKALLFRAVPATAPSSLGSRVFSVFQDYGSDTCMWLPPAVPDFGMRDPIETFPGSGVFLGSASQIDVHIRVVPGTGLVVPGAAIVTP
jgi:hypothetical protein